MPAKADRALLWSVLLSSLVCWACAPESAKQRAIEQAFVAERTRYARASLIDVYKFFFQGAFGPGHMVPDAAAARQYLEHELAAATEFDTPLCYAVGYEKEYYRVNLKAIRQEKISSEDLLHAFVASANAAVPPSLEEWKKEWQVILQAIAKHRASIAGFAEDQARLDDMLDRGALVVHHSEIFETEYHPHYRVIHRSHMEKFSNVLSVE